MFNKKATFIHWTIFGILLALAAFILFAQGGKLIKVEVKGEDHLYFLEMFFLEAEKDLLTVDQSAKEAGWKSVIALAKSGGYPEKESSCGQYQALPLWNKVENWCLPTVKESFSEMVLSNLKQKIPEKTFFNIRTDSLDLLGQGNPWEITALPGAKGYMKYRYNTNFRAPLGYDLSEFFQVMNSAQTLVKSCQNQRDLNKCLKEQMAVDFGLNNCPSNQKRLISAFYQAYLDCTNTEEDDCICGYIGLKDYAGENGQKILFSREPGTNWITLSEGHLTEKLDLGDIFHPEPAEFELEAGEGNFLFKSIDRDYFQQDYENIHFYKTKTNGKERLDIIKVSLPKWIYWNNEEKPAEPIKICSQKKVRQRLFCAESQYSVYNSDKMKVQINYKLALDFTPALPFSPENQKAEFDSAKNAWRATFNREETADSYNLYYTNWPSAKDKKGQIKEIFLTLPEALGYFQKSPSFENPKTENCPADKAIGTAYLCGNQLIYLWQDGSLVAGKNYFLTITSIKSGKESRVEQFVGFSS